MLNIDDRLIKETLPIIKPNGLAVLMVISIHLNKESGVCFPSHKRLMDMTGLGSESVYNALKALKKQGILISSQSIDSKHKTFSRRTFKVNTDYIGIFVTAKNAPALEVEPLTDLPYTAEPDAAEPDAANHETYLLNESQQLNELEQLNNTSKIDVAVFDPEVNTLIVDSLEFKADAFPPTPIAPPPAPRRFDPFDIDKEANELKSDPLAAERFARETGTPPDNMYTALGAMVDSFIADQKSTGYNYSNRIEFRKHFFNLVRRKAEIARNGQRVVSGSTQPQQHHSVLPAALRNLVGK